MFIQTEATPNPATMKFLPGCPVLASGTMDFRDVEKARRRSPLATALFGIEGVTGVFFGADFIAISKREGQEWCYLRPAIICVIMEHFTSGVPVLKEEDAGYSVPDADLEEDFDKADAELVAAIKNLLETRVRPAVAQDGGDIVFHGYRDGVVLLKMRGACAGCPSSTATLRNGIESLLRHFVPEVQEVRAI